MIQLGLVGKSLQHTLSPVIHGAFFDELGIDGDYCKIEVPDEAELPSVLQQLEGEGFLGVNVTIPYKMAVTASLGGLDASASLACAVNTIKFSPGLSKGHNTDIGGLAEALYRMELDRAGDVGEKSVVILGSGGAARAAVVAVSTLGYKKLRMVGRKPESVQSLLDEILGAAERQSLVANCKSAQICDYDSLADMAAENLDEIGLVINATPIGQKESSVPDNVVRFFQCFSKSENSGRAFVDLVYSTTETPLCKTAREAGFEQVEDGKEMLVNQARLAFKIWTGQLPDGQLARERLSSI